MVARPSVAARRWLDLDMPWYLSTGRFALLAEWRAEPAEKN
jgi:hypothetical protein